MENFDIYIEERTQDKTHVVELENNRTIEIFLNKGSAFGSNHATTLLSIESLKFLYIQNKSINSALDIGSGSGILSIFIQKMSFTQVDYSEIDGFARNECLKNFKSNFINKLKLPELVENPLGKNKKYDLVVANISGSFIPKNLLKISEIIRDNGYLVISGFNINKEDKYLNLASGINLNLVKSFKKDPWISMIFSKK